MSKTKLLKFKRYPSNWLYRAYFKFEEMFIYPIELPNFPKELQVDSSELKKGLDRISAFAISRYLIQDIISFKPRNILKNLITLPRTIFTVISQARSKYQEKCARQELLIKRKDLKRLIKLKLNILKEIEKRIKKLIKIY